MHHYLKMPSRPGLFYPCGRWEPTQLWLLWLPGWCQCSSLGRADCCCCDLHKLFFLLGTTLSSEYDSWMLNIISGQTLTLKQGMAKHLWWHANCINKQYLTCCSFTNTDTLPIQSILAWNTIDSLMKRKRHDRDYSFFIQVICAYNFHPVFLCLVSSLPHIHTDTVSEHYFCPEMVEKLHADPPTHPLCRRLCFAASSNPPLAPAFYSSIHLHLRQTPMSALPWQWMMPTLFCDAGTLQTS